MKSIATQPATGATLRDIFLLDESYGTDMESGPRSVARCGPDPVPDLLLQAALTHAVGFRLRIVRCLLGLLSNLKRLLRGRPGLLVLDCGRRTHTGGAGARGDRQWSQ